MSVETSFTFSFKNRGKNVVDPKYEADSIKRQNNLTKAKTRLYIYREILKRESEAKKKEAEKELGKNGTR